MKVRAHDLAERAGALALLAASVVLALWSRERVATVEAEAARREDQLEQLVEWQRAEVDRPAGQAPEAPAFAAFFAGGELVVAQGAGIDYLVLQPCPAPGRAP